MARKTIAAVSALAISAGSWADGDFPARMEGKWKASTAAAAGGSVIELVKLEGPDKAQIKVTMTNVPSSHGAQYGLCNFGTVATVAERSGGTWQISAPHTRCPSFTIFLNPVDGKKRFEGNYSAVGAGTGPIYYEWE